MYFYKKKDGKIVSELNKNKNKKAKEKLSYLKKEFLKKIPKRYLKKWKEVKLYNPDGKIAKADGLIINPEEGAFSLKNKLNDLTGKDWVKFTSSWFIFNALAKDLKEERAVVQKFRLNPSEHPATFSPTMISQFINYFTKERDLVIDPFSGIGTTMVACDRTKRKGVGIELNKKYFSISQARSKQKIFNGNSLLIDEILNKNKISNIDFCITSPPYWDILNRSTGGFKEKRSIKNLDTNYSNKDQNDLGNELDYNQFIEKLLSVFLKLKNKLKENAYIVVIIKNVKKDGKNYPLAWDFAKKMSEHFELKDEKIWCQDKVALAPYGYPYAYTTNIHHHYCLVFKN